MPRHALITLTTDFGTRDGYVGAMKGAILSINPEASIVDITHEIDPRDIFGGAHALRASCRSYPRGTIHVAVVDPGVGGLRRPICIVTECASFVGPDNGLFSLILENEQHVRGIELNESKYFFTPVSATFHGRDIFAPVAAYLSLGVDPEEFGPVADDIRSLSIPQPVTAGGVIEGQVLHIDHFGNLITNIARDMLPEEADSQLFAIETGSLRLYALSPSYDSVRSGTPLAVIGSSGFLEISVNQGSAKERLDLSRGDPVRVEIGRRTEHQK